MPTSAARRTPPSTPLVRPSPAQPIVIYVASSLDGTSFALDAGSQQRVRAAFPAARASPRRVFISHDTREAVDQSVSRFEDPIAVLLTGVATDDLVKKFGALSFRDPHSERELGRRPALGRPAQRG